MSFLSQVQSQLDNARVRYGIIKVEGAITTEDWAARAGSSEKSK